MGGVWRKHKNLFMEILGVRKRKAAVDTRVLNRWDNIRILFGSGFDIPTISFNPVD